MTRTALLASLALLSACTTTPGIDPFPDGPISAGMTKAEVREAVGPPHAITSRDGREVWVYHRAGRSIVVRFDDPTVDDVAYNPPVDE